MRRGAITNAVLWALIILFGLPGSLQPPLAAQGTQGDHDNPPKDAEKPATKEASTRLHIAVTALKSATPVQGARVELSWEGDNVPAVTKITDQKGVVDLEARRGKVLIQVIATAQHLESDGVFCVLKKDLETIRFTLVEKNTAPVAPVKTCETYVPNHDND
jgi:hypothetical protein